MGRTDRLMGALDTAWLRLTRQPYRLDLRLDLRRELDAEDREDMEAALAAVDAVYSDSDHTAAIHEVRPLEDEDGVNATYEGRVDARPQVAIDPAAPQPAATLAHELGHDAIEALDADPDTDPLIEQTYGELVAGLTAREAMEHLDEEPPEHHPFRYGHIPEWDRLETILDPGQRERADDAVEAVRDAADRTDWQGMADATSAVPSTEADSMVAGELCPELYRTGTAIAEIGRAWKEMEYAPDQVAHEMLDDRIDDPETPAEQRIADASDRTSSYTDAMDGALSTAVEQYDDAIAELPEDPEDVIDDLGDQRYGRDHDQHLDLPHTVGDQLAAALYEEDMHPMTVMDDPDQAAGLCRDALEHTIDQAPAPEDYDLGPLVADAYG